MERQSRISVTIKAVIIINFHDAHHKPEWQVYPFIPIPSQHSPAAALYRSQTGEGREPDRSIQGWGVSTNVSDTDQHDNMPPTGSDKEFSFYYKNTQWLVVLAMKHLQSLKTVCKQNIYYMLQANNTVLLQWKMTTSREPSKKEQKNSNLIENHFKFLEQTF